MSDEEWVILGMLLAKAGEWAKSEYIRLDNPSKWHSDFIDEQLERFDMKDAAYIFAGCYAENFGFA